MRVQGAVAAFAFATLWCHWSSSEGSQGLTGPQGTRDIQHPTSALPSTRARARGQLQDSSQVPTQVNGSYPRFRPRFSPKGRPQQNPGGQNRTGARLRPRVRPPRPFLLAKNRTNPKVQARPSVPLWTQEDTQKQPDEETLQQDSWVATESEFLQRKLAALTPAIQSQINGSSLQSYSGFPYQYALPECATQQVCNAIYTRLDRINALCACPDKFGDPCSVSFNGNDAHTIELVTDRTSRALTLIKTCEPIAAVRECRGSRDWSLLALQNVRTGKSHYLVVCRCVRFGTLEGPIAHENPPYAKIPGIRVYGMVCTQQHPWHYQNRRSLSTEPKDGVPKFPWHLVRDFVTQAGWY